MEQSIVMNIVRRLIDRFKSRRHDKLTLWIGLFAGVSFPILLCWTIPNMWSDWRNRTEVAKAQAAQIEKEDFEDTYADLFALCDIEDSGVEPSGVMPSDPRIIVVQNGQLADVQDDLPAEWQPDSSGDVSVVICIDREKIQEVGSCEDGTIPNISSYEGYEIEAFNALSNDPDLIAPGGCQHPELSGKKLYRYASKLRGFDAVSGEMILLMALWGSEPGVCTTRDQNLSPRQALYGERITGEDLREEFLAIFES